MKIKQFIRKYPMIWGMLGIGLLLGVIVLFTLQQRRDQGESTVVTEELQREQSVDYIINPKTVVSYFIQAIDQKDMDKGMRAFAIDERSMGMNFLYKIKGESQEWQNSYLALSDNYRPYVSLASAELTGEYATMLEKWTEEYNKLVEPRVVSMQYIYPTTKGQESSKGEEAERLCQLWGGDQLCEIEVIFQSEERYYTSDFTVMDYGSTWKIFDTGKKLFSPLQEEYNTSKVNEQEERRTEKKILEEYKEKDIKKNKKKCEELLRTGDIMLPPNYYISSMQTSETPEKEIKKFFTYIQRTDFVSAMGCGMSMTAQPGMQELIVQGERAKSLELFLYDVMLHDVKYSEDLKNRDMKLIMEALNPEYCFDIQVLEVKQTKEKQRYLVKYGYGHKEYQVIISMMDTDEGYKIKDIGKVSLIK